MLSREAGEHAKADSTLDTVTRLRRESMPPNAAARRLDDVNRNPVRKSFVEPHFSQSFLKHLSAVERTREDVLAVAIDQLWNFALAPDPANPLNGGFKAVSHGLHLFWAREGTGTELEACVAGQLTKLTDHFDPSLLVGLLGGHQVVDSSIEFLNEDLNDRIGKH